MSAEALSLQEPPVVPNSTEGFDGTIPADLVVPNDAATSESLDAVPCVSKVTKAQCCNATVTTGNGTVTTDSFDGLGDSAHPSSWPLTRPVRSQDSWERQGSLSRSAPDALRHHDSAHSIFGRHLGIKALRRMIFMTCGGIIGVVVFLLIPVHMGCDDDKPGLNFRWWMVSTNWVMIIAFPAAATAVHGLFPLWSSSCVSYSMYALFMAVLNVGLIALYYVGYGDIAVLVGGTGPYTATVNFFLIWIFFGSGLLWSPRRQHRQQWSFGDASSWGAGGSPRVSWGAPDDMNDASLVATATEMPARSLLSSWASSFSRMRFRTVESKILLSHFPDEVESHEEWWKSEASDGQCCVSGVHFIGSLASRHERPRFLRKPFHQWLLVGGYIFFSSFIYIILSTFMGRLLSFNPQCGLMVFSVLIYIIKVFLKVFGFVCDFGKSGVDHSAYYIAQIGATFLYYMFYRAIFERVDSWLTFVGLQLTHLANEWFQHVFRASHWYYSSIRKNAVHGPKWMREATLAMFLSNQPNVSSTDWANFIALETAITAFVITFSGIVFALGYCIMFYSTTTSLDYPDLVFIHDPGKFRTLGIQLIIQVTTEMVNVGLMELWFRRRLGRSGAISRFDCFFKSHTISIWFFTLCAYQAIFVWARFQSQNFCKATAFFQ